MAPVARARRWCRLSTKRSSATPRFPGGGQHRRHQQHHLDARRGGRTLGFDCGPGNVLLDGWSRRHLGAAFDEDGAWAKRGHTDAGLLETLLAEPFLEAAPPKSTGRELFRMEWLDQRLEEKRAPEDVQSTLTDFTAHAIVDALDRFCGKTDEIYLSGGGARNPTLVDRIEGLTRGRPVAPTDVLGVPTAHVESMAFAWLAMKFVRREAVDLTAVTGARHPRVLGGALPGLKNKKGARRLPFPGVASLRR
jgi:anhydro-N-acetylmuramic acid kinase